MKTHTLRSSLLLTAGFALLAVPAALANDDYKAKFKSMDTDGDGQVSRTEHAVGAQVMFNHLDLNRDGLVSSWEMTAAQVSKANDRDEKSVADKIRMIDRDSDGQVSAFEHETASAAMFDRMDDNGDGFLTEREMKAGHKAMKKDR